MPDTQSGLSLWPSEFGEVPVQAPVAILRQQGAILGEQTQNIVIGRVTTQGAGGIFTQKFHLFCPPLGYQAELFSVRHGIDFYPAKITLPEDNDGPSDGPSFEARNADEFKAKLKEVFAREKTKKIIASLLAQSRQ